MLTHFFSAHNSGCKGLTRTYWFPSADPVLHIREHVCTFVEGDSIKRVREQYKRCGWGTQLWRRKVSNCILTHIEARTTWLTFCRWHLHQVWRHFRNKKLSYFDSNFTEICSCNRNLVYFSNLYQDRYLEHFQWNRPQVNATRPHWW